MKAIAKKKVDLGAVSRIAPGIFSAEIISYTKDQSPYPIELTVSDGRSVGDTQVSMLLTKEQARAFAAALIEASEEVPE